MGSVTFYNVYVDFEGWPQAHGSDVRVDKWDEDRAYLTSTCPNDYFSSLSCHKNSDLIGFLPPSEDKKEENALFVKIQRTLGMSDTQKFGVTSHVKIRERRGLKPCIIPMQMKEQ